MGNCFCCKRDKETTIIDGREVCKECDHRVDESQLKTRIARNKYKKTKKKTGRK